MPHQVPMQTPEDAVSNDRALPADTTHSLGQVSSPSLDATDEALTGERHLPELDFLNAEARPAEITVEDKSNTEDEEPLSFTEEERIGHTHITYKITIVNKAAKDHPIVINLRAPEPMPREPYGKRICSSSFGKFCHNDAWISSDIDQVWATSYIMRSSPDVISSIVLTISFSQGNDSGNDNRGSYFSDCLKFELDNIPALNGQETVNRGPILDDHMNQRPGMRFHAVVERIGPETVKNVDCEIEKAGEWAEAQITHDGELCRKGKASKGFTSIISSFRSKL